MADLSSCPPLNRSSVLTAHERIKPYIHRTPVLTCQTLTTIASTPRTAAELKGTEWEGQEAAKPTMRLFFKCENHQKIGAFKARGAFHAVGRLIDEVGLSGLGRGVVTHSSGNHAQALALAARTHGIPAHIVMPTISTPSKIAGTQSQGANVIFSGSTSQEREAVVADVIAKTGAILVPPYDHPDIILGQGTLAIEMQEQVERMLASGRMACSGAIEDASAHTNGDEKTTIRKGLDAVLAPCGGGGMLSGVATALDGTGIRVYGAEPSYQGGDDARRGLLAGKRIESVKTLTVADGLRTPLGEITWKVVSDKEKVKGVYAVTETQIKDAMRLLLERAKLFVEPSAAVGVAVALYNEDFRRMVQEEAGDAGWDVGCVLTGGNTTVEAIAKLFAPESEERAQRQEGTVTRDGDKVAENVAG